MDYDYDTIILGAGTAGLSAGSVFEKSGKSYIILDKKDEIGLPVRSTGAVSLEWVKKLGMPTDDSIVASRISSVKFATDTGKSVELRYDHPIGMVYDFTKYEKFLAEKFAGKLNIRMKTRVTSIEGNTVQTETETLTAENIIMAAGPQSSFGSRLDRTSVLVAYEEMRELPRRDDFEMIIWYSDMVKGGYFWDFADTDSTRKIGLCYYPLNPSRPKDILDTFTRKFPEVDGKCIHTMAHQIPLAEPVNTVSSGNRLYTGDMVNAVLNTTAGGLQGAFWTGKAAAEAILSGDLNNYQAKWDMEIRPWLMKHHRLHKRMHRKGSKSIGNLMTLAKIMPHSVQKRVFGGL